MTITETAAPAPDLTLIKRRQQQMWASGDFHAVGDADPAGRGRRSAARSTSRPAGACSTSRPAAATPRSRRRGAAATSSASTTCPRCSSAAACAPRPRASRSASSRATPRRSRSPDASFDAVALRVRLDVRAEPRQAAAELTRVVRPGGRIGLATWMPDGFIGEMLKVVAGHVPPPAGVSSPLLWGTKAYVSDLLGDKVSAIACTEQTFTFRFRSAEAFVEYFRTYYGPTLKAFEAVGDEGARRALRRPRLPRAPPRRHGHGPGRHPGDVAGDGRDSQRVRDVHADAADAALLAHRLYREDS